MWHFGSLISRFAPTECTSQSALLTLYTYVLLKLSTCESPAQEMAILTNMVTWCGRLKVRCGACAVMHTNLFHATMLYSSIYACFFQCNFGWDLGENAPCPTPHEGFVAKNRVDWKENYLTLYEDSPPVCGVLSQCYVTKHPCRVGWVRDGFRTQNRIKNRIRIRKCNWALITG